jgi:selenocysteine lyase/cysteine desulfurase
VLVSSVLFETAAIVPGLDRIASVCARRGAELLIDAYHHLNVVPFDVAAMGLERAFITGGGYKYCQLGEGNCFLRVPDGCRLRPILTGWFAEFETLEDTGHNRVTFGSGAAAFAGATYDPTSHYRAAAVFDFHQQQGLTPGELRRISQHQVGLLVTAFEQLDVPPSVASIEPMPLQQRGGFVAIRTSQARDLAHRLRGRGVFVDARGEVLRMGPAPYLRDDQLGDAVAVLGETLFED